MNIFAIKTNIGFVSGLNRSMLMIDITENPRYIKTFKTEASAKKYAEKYSNAGYGLTKYSIVSLKK